ncbi:MAG: phosphate ABC transporter substrate-binding protein PstS [Rhizomicrobium sp.]
MRIGYVFVAIAALFGLCGAASAAGAGFGVGATFPYPVYAAWADGYNKASGQRVNYQSIGSGGGIAQIEAGTVTFGASDVPMLAAERDKVGLVQFPTIIGGVVPIVHLKGVAPGQLILSGPVLADIFRGGIRHWNDPAIKALNPGLTLPNRAIAIVTRSDKSGTTYTFTTYLARFVADWGKTIGVGIGVNWPAEVIGAKGTEGLANHVMHAEGAIGFVEYTYARQNQLGYVRLRNKAGKIVTPGAASFKAAASGVDWDAAGARPDEAVDMLDSAADGAWPITAPTYVLMRKKPTDKADAASVLAFFDWAFSHGDGAAEKLDYVPLPAAAKARVHQIWKQIDSNGL